MNNDYNFYVKKIRPEEKYEKVTDYFKGKRIENYANSKSMMLIQERITTRALELLSLKKKSFILDAGCGPGFASIYLNELGFNVVAFDIITEFLYYYNIHELNPVAADMCFPPFKPKTFDAIISISALQWIYRNIKNKNMEFKLINLAKSFYKILKPNSKAIFQFYPKNSVIMEEIRKIIAKNTNFKGNFIIDNPNNPKKRRIYLVLRNS